VSSCFNDWELVTQSDPDLTARVVAAREAVTRVRQITHLAINQPWPGRKRSGVRGAYENGFDGARAARVLLTLLRRAEHIESLFLTLDVRQLAIHCGLANGENVKDALVDLHRAGWIYFRPGTRDDYDDSGWAAGDPSTVVFRYQENEGQQSPYYLPLPTLDVFVTGRAGTAGWLIMTLLHGRFDGQSKQVLGLTDLASITGLTYERVKRTLPAMVEERLCVKAGRKYEFYQDIADDIEDRHGRGDYEFAKRLENYAERQVRRRELPDYQWTGDEIDRPSKPGVIQWRRGIVNWPHR